MQHAIRTVRQNEVFVFHANLLNCEYNEFIRETQQFFNCNNISIDVIIMLGVPIFILWVDIYIQASYATYAVGEVVL